MKRTALYMVAAGLLAVTVFAADPVVSRRDAARLQAKLDRIAKGSLTGGKTAETPITETEINSYLRYELGDRIPPGVTDPWLSILEEGRLSGRATVDLSRVGQNRTSGGMLDPFNLLTGSLPLTVNGVLKTKNGVGT